MIDEYDSIWSIIDQFQFKIELSRFDTIIPIMYNLTVEKKRKLFHVTHFA